jgi:hypothetical protein
MERNRAAGGHVPAIAEIKQARGRISQRVAASIVYTNERTWRTYELGKSRMHPSMWELFLIKVDKDR